MPVKSYDTACQCMMQLMTRHRVRHMPVLRDGQHGGIISIGDVVKHRVRPMSCAMPTWPRTERPGVDHTPASMPVTSQGPIHGLDVPATLLARADEVIE